MSALVLDAGALVAVDRNDRSVIAQLLVAERRGIELRTNAIVVAQAWRDDRGRQVGLARLLAAVDVRSISEADGRAAGVLVARSGTKDPIDATVALLAEPGDRILTSDPHDLTALVAAAGTAAVVVPCWPPRAMEHRGLPDLDLTAPPDRRRARPSRPRRRPIRREAPL